MMNRTFRSSISLSLLIPLVLLTSAALVLNIIGGVWPVAVLLLLMQLFILHLYLTTTYTITEAGLLTIRCGFFYKMHIDIQEIKKISLSNDPANAPALSLKRIAIWHTFHERILVSPREKQEFIDALVSINPSIEKEDC